MKKIILMSLLVICCGSALSEDVKQSHAANTSAFDVFMGKKAPNNPVLKRLDFQQCESICSAKYYNCLNNGTDATVCLNIYIGCVNNPLCQ